MELHGELLDNDPYIILGWVFEEQVSLPDSNSIFVPRDETTATASRRLDGESLMDEIAFHRFFRNYDPDCNVSTVARSFAKYSRARRAYQVVCSNEEPNIINILTLERFIEAVEMIVKETERGPLGKWVRKYVQPTLIEQAALEERTPAPEEGTQAPEGRTQTPEEGIATPRERTPSPGETSATDTSTPELLEAPAITWEERTDEDGYVYYFSPSTGESKWAISSVQQENNELFPGELPLDATEEDHSEIVSPYPKVTTGYSLNSSLESDKHSQDMRQTHYYSLPGSRRSSKSARTTGTAGSRLCFSNAKLKAVFSEYPTMTNKTARQIVRSNACGNGKIESYATRQPCIRPPVLQNRRTLGIALDGTVNRQLGYFISPLRENLWTEKTRYVTGKEIARAWNGSGKAPSDTVPSYAYKHAADRSRKSAKCGVYDRLTDVRGYTGTHRHRFDMKTGVGRGLIGRDQPGSDIEAIAACFEAGVIPSYSDNVTRMSSPLRNGAWKKKPSRVPKKNE